MQGWDAFKLRTQRLGALPVVNWFCDRLGLDELLEQFVPANDRRPRLAPAAALGGSGPQPDRRSRADLRAG